MARIIGLKIPRPGSIRAANASPAMVAASSTPGISAAAAVAGEVLDRGTGACAAYAESVGGIGKLRLDAGTIADAPSIRPMN
jgi:hypothetical protein